MYFTNLWVTALFYVPMVPTYIHPLLGLGVSTAMVVWHFRYEPFLKKKQAIEVEPFDPMDLIWD
mgnify:FL=1